MWPYLAATLKNHLGTVQNGTNLLLEIIFLRDELKEERGHKFSLRGEPALRAPYKTISSDQIKQLFFLCSIHV